MEEEVVEEEKSFHQVLKEKFIEGGPEFMGIVLLCLILGLAIVIERIIYFYKTTLQKYMKDRSLLPKNQLIEISFKELEKIMYLINLL